VLGRESGSRPVPSESFVEIGMHAECTISDHYVALFIEFFGYAGAVWSFDLKGQDSCSLGSVGRADYVEPSFFSVMVEKLVCEVTV